MPLTKSIPILILLFCITTVTSKTIYVGISSMLGSKDSGQIVYGESARNALIMFEELFEEKYNSTVYVAGEPYNVEIVTLYDEGNFTQMKINYQIFCEDPSIFAVIAPSNSDYTEACVEIAENCSKLVLNAGSFSTSVYREDKYRNSFQSCPSPDRIFNNILPSFKYTGLTNVSIISGSQPFHLTLCNITDETADTYGFKVVNREFLVSNITHTATDFEIDQVLDKIIAKNSSVLIFCAFFKTINTTLHKIKSRNFSPSILAAPRTPGFDSMPAEISDYLFSMANNHPDLKFYSDEWFTDYRDYITRYEQRFNTPIFVTGPCHFYAMVLFKEALESSLSLTLRDVSESFSRTYYPSILGLIEYDGNHSPRLLEAFVQYFNKTSSIVWPPLAAKTAMIMPVPTWEERVYDPEYTSIEIVFAFIAIFFIVISLIIITIIIFWRNQSILRVSMPLFLVLILVGSILMYISVFFWIDRQLSFAKCLCRYWFLNIGFTILYGSLFAKSFGVWKMWRTKIGSNVVVTQRFLLSIVMALFGIQSLLLIFLSIFGGVYSDKQVEVPHKPKFDREYCGNDIAGTVLLSLMVSISFLLIIISLVIGWGSRKITFLAFNESKIINFATYNVAFFSIFALIVVLNQSEVYYQTAFILKAICILFLAFFTVAILFGNKFWLIYHNKTARSKINTQSINLSSRSSSPKNSAVDTNDDEKTVTVPKKEYEKLLSIKKDYEKIQQKADPEE